MLCGRKEVDLQVTASGSASCTFSRLLRGVVGRRPSFLVPALLGLGLKPMPTPSVDKREGSTGQGSPDLDGMSRRVNHVATPWVLGALCCLAGGELGCGQSDETDGLRDEPDIQDEPDELQVGPEVPPQNATDLEAWLQEGHYKSWKCESAPHAARSPSPHGMNRICSNTLLSAHGAGEYPIGAATVKELYNAAGTTQVGVALALKVSAGQGEAWYWFERLDSSGVVVDGLGSSGPAKNICVGCHAGAGSDAAHSGHDLIYTQVK